MAITIFPQIANLMYATELAGIFYNIFMNLDAQKHHLMQLKFIMMVKLVMIY